MENENDKKEIEKEEETGNENESGEGAISENPPYPPLEKEEVLNPSLEKGEVPNPLLEKRKTGVLKKIVFGIAALVVMVGIVQIAVADKYEAQVLVIEGKGKVGVNPTAERLDFGDLSGDTSAVRYVTLQAGGADTYIYVWKFGSIAELIKLSENNFTMKKGDEKKLEFSVYMPPSAPVGEKYTGHIWIFKVPKIW